MVQILMKIIIQIADKKRLCNVKFHPVLRCKKCQFTFTTNGIRNNSKEILHVTEKPDICIIQANCTWFFRKSLYTTSLGQLFSNAGATHTAKLMTLVHAKENLTWLRKCNVSTSVEGSRDLLNAQM